MSAVADPTEFWFARGAEVFERGCVLAQGLPALGDAQAQLWWLGGFAGAWAEAGVTGGGSHWSGLPVEDALVDALADHSALLAECWAHGGARMARPRH